MSWGYSNSPTIELVVLDHQQQPVPSSGDIRAFLGRERCPEDDEPMRGLSVIVGYDLQYLKLPRDMELITKDRLEVEGGTGKDFLVVRGVLDPSPWSVPKERIFSFDDLEAKSTLHPPDTDVFDEEGQCDSYIPGELVGTGVSLEFDLMHDLPDERVPFLLRHRAEQFLRTLVDFVNSDNDGAIQEPENHDEFYATLVRETPGNIGFVICNGTHALIFGSGDRVALTEYLDYKVNEGQRTTMAGTVGNGSQDPICRRAVYIDDWGFRRPKDIARLLDVLQAQVMHYEGPPALFEDAIHRPAEVQALFRKYLGKVHKAGLKQRDPDAYMKQEFDAMAKEGGGIAFAVMDETDDYALVFGKNTGYNSFYRKASWNYHVRQHDDIVGSRLIDDARFAFCRTDHPKSRLAKNLGIPESQVVRADHVGYLRNLLIEAERYNFEPIGAYLDLCLQKLLEIHKVWEAQAEVVTFRLPQE